MNTLSEQAMQAVQHLQSNGFAILHNLCSAGQMNTVAAELQPQFEQTTPSQNINKTTNLILNKLFLNKKGNTP